MKDDAPEEIEELNAVHMFTSGTEPFIVIGG